MLQQSERERFTMLTNLQVQHFKNFKDLDLTLAPLTLLTGTNASGKSTVLQAMTLLHQTMVESDYSDALNLNGSCISLGSGGDVLDQISGSRNFSIGLSSDRVDCVWSFKVEDRLGLSVPIEAVSWQEEPDWEGNPSDSPHYLVPQNCTPESPMGQLCTIIQNLTYLSTDRVGPSETYPASNFKLGRNVGSRGQYAPWVLYQFNEYQPIDGLLLEDTSPILQRQAEAWMQHFFPGSGLQLNPIPGTNLIVLGLRTNRATDFHRPQNVGYGLSHVLPIITAVLAAEKGSTILIENPEAHLHPMGQSKMGEFLARCVAAGLQLIIETHSDHILNGIRKAVKKGILEAEKTQIHFFLPRDEEDLKPQVTSPTLNNEGRLSYWPGNFFDQIEKDLAELTGFGA